MGERVDRLQSVVALPCAQENFPFEESSPENVKKMDESLAVDRSPFLLGRCFETSLFDSREVGNSPNFSSLFSTFLKLLKLLNLSDF